VNPLVLKSRASSFCCNPFCRAPDRLSDSSSPDATGQADNCAISQSLALTMSASPFPDNRPCSLERALIDMCRMLILVIWLGVSQATRTIGWFAPPARCWSVKVIAELQVNNVLRHRHRRVSTYLPHQSRRGEGIVDVIGITRSRVAVPHRPPHWLSFCWWPLSGSSSARRPWRRRRYKWLGPSKRRRTSATTTKACNRYSGAGRQSNQTRSPGVSPATASFTSCGAVTLLGNTHLSAAVRVG